MAQLKGWMLVLVQMVFSVLLSSHLHMAVAGFEGYDPSALNLTASDYTWLNIKDEELGNLVISRDETSFLACTSDVILRINKTSGYMAKVFTVISDMIPDGSFTGISIIDFVELGDGRLVVGLAEKSVMLITQPIPYTSSFHSLQFYCFAMEGYYTLSEDYNQLDRSVELCCDSVIAIELDITSDRIYILTAEAFIRSFHLDPDPAADKRVITVYRESPREGFVYMRVFSRSLYIATTRTHVKQFHIVRNKAIQVADYEENASVEPIYPEFSVFFVLGVNTFMFLSSSHILVRDINTDSQYDLCYTPLGWDLTLQITVCIGGSFYDSIDGVVDGNRLVFGKSIRKTKQLQALNFKGECNAPTWPNSNREFWPKMSEHDTGQSVYYWRDLIESSYEDDIMSVTCMSNGTWFGLEDSLEETTTPTITTPASISMITNTSVNTITWQEHQITPNNTTPLLTDNHSPTKNEDGLTLMNTTTAFYSSNDPADTETPTVILEVDHITNSSELNVSSSKENNDSVTVGLAVSLGVFVAGLIVVLVDFATKKRILKLFRRNPLQVHVHEVTNSGMFLEMAESASSENGGDDSLDSHIYETIPELVDTSQAATADDVAVTAADPNNNAVSENIKSIVTATDTMVDGSASTDGQHSGINSMLGNDEPVYAQSVTCVEQTYL